jgi:hypothetical protein
LTNSLCKWVVLVLTTTSYSPVRILRHVVL